MSVFPGLCGDIAASSYRVFLGTLPALAVEERFLRQVQPVFPWYASRKRVKEQANEFLEIDLASCDPELFLRYTHVYYARRQIHDEMIDRQLTLIESGKAAKVADNALMNCLTSCNALITPRLQHELNLLQQTKKQCRVPHRRELNPDAPLEAHDYLCLMRVVEEDVCGVQDAEMKARAFLPRDLVAQKAKQLATDFFGGAENAAGELDKKDQKLLQRHIPGDYSKVGSVEKLRPSDVTALHRFFGQRACKTSQQGFFAAALWGHVFRKVASHPAYLSRSSMYWSRHSGRDVEAPFTTMPLELATAVCAQQQLFPALKFRSQYLYTSPDLARQQWKSDHVIPLLRLFPLLGAHAAEDLAASMVVEGEWAKLQLSPETNPMQGDVAGRLREVVELAASQYESNMEAVLKKVEEGTRLVCPPLSEKDDAVKEQEEASA